MCGVRMERRKAERRLRQDNTKCQSCGHVNEPGHKFCGMCGSRVDRRLQDRRAASPEQPRATAMANAQLPTPEAPGRKSEPEPPPAAPAELQETQPPAISEIPPHPRTPPAIFRSEPSHASTISGPSFLGLGDQPDNAGQYLFEDEGSSGGILRKLVLVAILAAIAGLIFVGWRSSSWANPKLPPPPKAQPTASPSPQAKSQDPAAGAADAAAKNPDTSPATAAQSDAQETPATESKASSPAATAGGPDDRPLNPDKQQAASPRQRASQKAPQKTSEDAPSSQHRPSAMLLRAQQYLQGKGGVKQNCEQGLMYLRAAAQKNEPAAAVQMGALYASGHCVQQDRVMAYRWFNSAHELDPANPWIQTNLDQLWAEMTPPQRRQVAQ